MKILCISDQIDPLVYSSSAKERFKDVDVVLSAGDLPMEYIDFVVSTLNKPAYFIFGNHNLAELKYYHFSKQEGRPDDSSMHHYHGAVYTGFKTVKSGNLLIAGVSGSIRYNDGQCQYTEQEMMLELIKLIPSLLLNKIRYGRFLDVFLTHAPPKDIHDKPDPCHRGFKCYRWFMDKFKPKYLVHGHIHLYDLLDPRITVEKETTVINAFSHYILEIPDEDLLRTKKGRKK